jgi:DNA-directed RNA polymerase specialized sigma24 family protein
MTATTTHLPDDTCLISGIQQGDQQSLSKLYDRYAAPLTGIILKIVPDAKIADEVLQKTFLLAWHQVHCSEKSPHVNTFTWLMHLARGIALSDIKFSMQQNHGTPDTVYSAANVLKGAACCSTGPKAIFDLMFYKGLNCREAASLLNITEKEVKQQFRSAVKSMEL